MDGRVSAGFFLSFLKFFFYPFFSPISWYPIVVSCLIATTPVRARERRRLKVMRPPIHNPTSRTASYHSAHPTRKPAAPMCWRVHLATLVSAARHRSRWCAMRQGQALPNPDDARPIVRRPTDLPVAAGYETEPGCEPRDSDGTAGAAVQRP